MDGNISKAAFWELVKFKYPTHQIGKAKLEHLISVAMYFMLKILQQWRMTELKNMVLQRGMLMLQH